MTCCLNTNLLINHFITLKDAFNIWLKRKFNQNQSTTKLNDQKDLKIEESKYIQKIGCKIPKYLIDDNFKNDHFNDKLTNKIEIDNDKQNLKFKSLNQDEWELYFVIDKEKEIKKTNNDTKINDLKDKNIQNHQNYAESNIGDFEWDDDFITDELCLNFNEQDQLINENKK